MEKDLKFKISILTSVDETQVTEETISCAICNYFGLEEDELKITKGKDKGKI